MRNEYTVDRLLLKKWTMESRFRGVRLVLFILLCALFVMTLALSIFYIIAGLNIYITICLVFGALICLYRAFITYPRFARRQYKRLSKTYGKDSWIRTITFENDCLTVREETAESRFDYTDILEVFEKDDSIHLKLKSYAYIRLYRTKFVDTTWDDCKTLILKKNPNVKYK